MRQHLTGLKIRRRRRARGLTQGELARRAGISPSYLNLIEQNKRPIAGALLDRLAAGLGVARAELDDEPERRLVDRLNEVLTDPALAGPGDHHRTSAELVGRFPEWANLVLKLYRALVDRNEAVLALADRLNRDPFLGESVHRILTHATAIRAASEILQKNDDLTAAERARFLAIVASDSDKLSERSRALADFFDSPDMRVRSATSMEHVDVFIFRTGNYFPELEDVAADFLRTHVPDGTSPLAAAEALLERHRAAEAAAAAGAPPEAPRARRFRVLKTLAAVIGGDAVEALVRHPALASDEARALAAAALHAYVAAAILMPYETFLAAAEQTRYDLDALCQRFDVSYEQAAHRLATLRRPGAEGVRFAFMRSDPSGYVTKRLPLTGLPLPRYGNACPLWVIYGALQTPGTTARAFGALPSGDRFLFFARAVEKGSHPVTLPRHLLSIMLACPAAEAGRVVYGDGMDDPRAVVPVGITCRLCPREGCSHRQEAPLLL